MEVTVEILKNRMVLTVNGKTITVEPTTPFTTTRLLVGTFMPAVECLKEGLSKVGATGIFKGKPKLLILPMAMAECSGQLIPGTGLSFFRQSLAVTHR